MLPHEIILVDDGSTDGTAEWVAEEFPGVSILLQENAGVSAARNAGIEASSGDWIALLDSDDRWLPEKLEKQHSALSVSDGYRICHTEERWVYRGKEKPVPSAYRKRGGWIFESCLPRCAIAPSSVVIKRSVFDDVGRFDTSLPACEDYDLWLRLAARMPVLLVNEPLVEKHGGHDDQLSAMPGLDRYRIVALQKALDDTALTAEQLDAVSRTLVEKCRIFAKGAAKRGNDKTARQYEALASRYA